MRRLLGLTLLLLLAGSGFAHAEAPARGANPTLANQRGEDALAYARRLGRAPLVALLERHFAPTPVPSTTDTLKGHLHDPPE